MKFSAAATVLAATAAANAGLIERRTLECTETTLSLAHERSFVAPLVNACTDSLQGGNFANPYNNKVCVAAAIAASPKVLRGMLTCKDASVPPETTFPPLDTGLFNSLSGCDGCEVTRQKFSDFVFSQIATEANPTYPNADDLKQFYIEPIFKFHVDFSASYQDFNDWLHLAGNVGHCTEVDPRGCPS